MASHCRLVNAGNCLVEALAKFIEGLLSHLCDWRAVHWALCVADWQSINLYVQKTVLAMGIVLLVPINTVPKVQTVDILRVL